MSNLDIYCNLQYDEFKSLEEQLKDWASRETTHTSVDGFYHKSISFTVAGVRFEFHGPNVKAAEPEEIAGSANDPPCVCGERLSDHSLREHRPCTSTGCPCLVYRGHLPDAELPATLADTVTATRLKLLQAMEWCGRPGLDWENLVPKLEEAQALVESLSAKIAAHISEQVDALKPTP